MSELTFVRIWEVLESGQRLSLYERVWLIGQRLMDREAGLSESEVADLRRKDEDEHEKANAELRVFLKKIMQHSAERTRQLEIENRQANFDPDKSASA